MKHLHGYLKDLNLQSTMARPSEHSRMLFDYFADQVDNDIQARLVSDLIGRYAALSRELDERNAQLARSEAALEKYNTQLEALVEEKVNEISTSQVAAIHALVKLAESRDDDTGAHIERTSAYCKLLAEKLYGLGGYGIGADYPENIALASPLHDIGKVGIPDAILLKPAKLTDDEFAVMKTHTVIGYKTLLSAEHLYPENTFLRTGMEISRHHHEKWDGGGYMDGLTGERIPLSARIMALSDVYDALRSRRPYKDPFPHERAVEIMANGRGSHFDPALFDVFLHYQMEFCDIFERAGGNPA